MNHRIILKNIILLITCIISMFFLIQTSTYTIEFPVSTLLFIFTTFNIILINLNKNNNLNSSIKFISILCIFFLILYIINFINRYIELNLITNDSAFFYRYILWITLLTNLFSIKKESNKLNDILTIIVCILISIIHYRYYIDPKFIHNLMNLSKDSIILQNGYNYILQYYYTFAIILLILYIQNIILNINIKNT